MASSEKKIVFSGFAWKFAESISKQGVSLLISIILARLIAPKEFGVIAMIQIFITLANVFVTAGFSSALIQKKDADELDFSTMLYCSFGMSVLLYFIMFFSAPFISDFYDMPDLTTLIRVFSLILIFYSYNSIQNAWVSRHMIFRKFFYSTLSGTIASGIIGISMAYMGFGVWALIGQIMSKTLINMVVMNRIISWRPKLIFSWNRAKSLMNYGWKILVTTLIAIFCEELRQLLVGKFYTPADLALFNRGRQFPNIISGNIDTTINSVLFPAMSNHSNDPVRIKEMTRKTICTSSYLLFFAEGVLAIIAYPLVEIVLTEKWIECVPYMQILCVSSMLSSVSTANLQAIKALGRSDVILKLEMYKKPIFILMVVIAVNISVLALVVSMPLYAIYSSIVNMRPNKKLISYSIKEQLKDYTPATLLFLSMVLVSYPISLLQINDLSLIVIQVVICCAVYFGLSYVFKVQSFGYLLKTVGDLKNKGKHNDFH